jgi:uncharacterized membrane protein YeaQ/YmgE (transglycosylase-associated protein family)
MSIFAWIVVGTIGGFIGSMLVKKRRQGILADLFFGVSGAVVAGWLFDAFGHSAVTGINPDSVLASAGGAIVVLVAYHLVRGSPARA